MNENEKIQSFGDMVNATEKLTRPWRILAAWLLAALVLTNAIWGLVHWSHIKYAYMTPEEFVQEQDFTNQSQSQHYGQGADSAD